VATMEVVSGVASAFAIAEYSLKIITFVSSLCSKLHEAPENLRMLEARLKDLNSIMKVIEKNASLNTQEMNSMLERCYRDAEKLDNLLASITTTPDDGKIQRYWKPLGSVIKENEVIDLCAKLYNHIILFSAYITSVDS
jgi:predicted nuclease with TOPRIM domain